MSRLFWKFFSVVFQSLWSTRVEENSNPHCHNLKNPRFSCRERCRSIVTYVNTRALSISSFDRATTLPSSMHRQLNHFCLMDSAPLETKIRKVIFSNLLFTRSYHWLYPSSSIFLLKFPLTIVTYAGRDHIDYARKKRYWQVLFEMTFEVSGLPCGYEVIVDSVVSSSPLHSWLDRNQFVQHWP